jgi:hypothetical protein
MFVITRDYCTMAMLAVTAYTQLMFGSILLTSHGADMKITLAVPKPMPNTVWHRLEEREELSIIYHIRTASPLQTGWKGELRHS